jgi:hypothetical protein
MLTVGCNQTPPTHPEPVCLLHPVGDDAELRGKNTRRGRDMMADDESDVFAVGTERG